MEEKDSVALIAAFAAGAILGVGATLLLRSEPALPALLLKRARHGRERLGRGARRAARGAGGAVESLSAVGHDALEQLRGELAEMVGTARDQLAEEIHAQLHAGKRGHQRRPR